MQQLTQELNLVRFIFFLLCLMHDYDMQPEIENIKASRTLRSMNPMTTMMHPMLTITLRCS